MIVRSLMYFAAKSFASGAVLPFREPPFVFFGIQIPPGVLPLDFWQQFCEQEKHEQAAIKPAIECTEPVLNLIHSVPSVNFRLFRCFSSR